MERNREIRKENRQRTSGETKRSLDDERVEGDGVYYQNKQLSFIAAAATLHFLLHLYLYLCFLITRTRRYLSFSFFSVIHFHFGCANKRHDVLVIPHVCRLPQPMFPLFFFLSVLYNLYMPLPTVFTKLTFILLLLLLYRVKYYFYP